MAYEFIELNLIPTGDKPVFHAAQYDVGRPIIIKLKNGEDDFTPTDLDLELQVRKVDNNIVTAVPDSVDGNVVTFITTQQMTACSGTNLCEVQLSDESTTIATLHFFLVVQRDVLNGGLSSASEIHDLEEQIAEIVPEVIGDDYYDKTEVDALIAEHTFDPTNYYDKTATDNLLAAKANTADLATVATTGSYNDLSDKPVIPDVSNYYTKSETYSQNEVDTLLSSKADTSSLSTVATTGDYDDLLNKPTLPDMSNYYTKSETYNKTEVDNALVTKQDKIETKSASGSLIHITDGGDNIPMKSLESEIVAVESGSGTKSPTNPYTISGFDSGIVSVCGVNLWDEQWELGNYDVTTGEKAVNNSNIRCKNPIPCKPNTQFYFKCSTNSGILFYDQNGTYINFVTGNNRVITTPSNAWFICFYVTSGYGTTYNNDISLNYPSSDTDYHAYNGNTYTFTFGQTVYGGHFDNKGNLVVTHGEYTLNGTETFNITGDGKIIYTDVLKDLAKMGTTVNIGELTAICESFNNHPDGVSFRTGNYDNTFCLGSSYLSVTTRLAFRCSSWSSPQDAQDYFALNNTKIIYELATPITLAITSQDIPTLSGENNIFSNCGDTDIEYFTSSADDIAALIRVMTGG